MSHEVPLILDHFFAHNSWTAIFQIFENSPLLVVESFSTYYGEVPLQKNALIRKFALYKNLSSRNKLKLHRKGMQKNGLNVKFALYFAPYMRAIFILHRRGSCKKMC